MLAEQLTDNEQYDEASSLWSLLIDSLGDGPYVTFSRGLCHLALGNYRQALRDFKVVNDFEQSLEAFYNIYLAKIGLDDTLGAVEALERALELSPGDSASILALATLYEATGSCDSALALLRPYVSEYPDDLGAMELLCYALFMLERYNEAVPCYENLLEADPDGGSAWSYLGWCYASSEKYRKAISCFEKAKTMETADYTDQWGLAEAYLGIGDTTKGLQYYKLALRAGPQEAVLYNDYAVLLQALGKVFSALDNYQKAAELDPTEWLYQWNLGNLYMALGRKSEANEALDKARLLKEKSQATD
jgi:tetratricopeptide (TPR) repeat protein